MVFRKPSRVGSAGMSMRISISVLAVVCIRLVLADEPTSQPIQVSDSTLVGFPIAKGWPLALPGEICGTPSVADLNGDGRLVIVVPTRRRNADQQFVHPNPTWAAK